MSTPPDLSTPPHGSTATGVFAAASGYPSELERRVDSTKDGLDGRGAGGVLRISDSVTLILGDCLAHLPIEADAVLTDPPYGVGYHHSGTGTYDRKALNGGNPARSLSKAILGDDRPFDPSPWIQYPIAILWGANHYASKLPDRPCWLGWDKHLKEHGTSFSEWECAWTNLKARRARMFRLYWHGALRAGDANAAEHLHPMQKPVELMAWCMEVAKLPTGATVLDPYMGSGSTAIACIRTGRKFIGIERDPEYFETARKRISAELEECVFEFPKGRDGGERQQALELEPRQTDNHRISEA